MTLPSLLVQPTADTAWGPFIFLSPGGQQLRQRGLRRREPAAAAAAQAAEDGEDEAGSDDEGRL